ncbi:hypothetical protein CVIRNUC_005940 [Coccomyxa viridis]|uniref:26S proteasome non-ATPase regulatory subunit 2 homolog n=1 Tax=Coccomyxa viridis TaxID=1274662 RepID=A0AAV1I8W9_9CHLO|nr:hypothetical protein CVIRNUC_005940 [Coccomyxa viridis]
MVEDKEQSEKAASERKIADNKKKKQKAEENKDADLSEEDLELKNNLLLMVTRLGEGEPGVQKLALQQVANEIRSATTSMTSVPKPLKFLRAHYQTLVNAYDKTSDEEVKRQLADVLSVLAITTAKEGERACLKYRLLGTKDAVASWGHEYIRSLSGEIGDEYHARREKEESVQDLLDLVAQIVPFHMTHNAEPEAVDLLLETEKLEWLVQHVDAKNYGRTCLYLTSCCAYLPEDDDSKVMQTAYQIYTKQKQYPDAMKVALMMNDQELVKKTFASCGDPLVQKQLGYLLARQGVALDLQEEESGMQSWVDNLDSELQSELQEIISNSKLSEMYLSLARDLDVMEPKLPDEVYKSHLVEGRQPAGPAVDSARQNLAATFVNAFVNAGFGQDKLVTASLDADGVSTDRVHWIFKNKDQGKTAATASLGLVTLWDVEGGLPQIDKFLYSKDNYVVAGALLAVGILNCGVQHENDPAYALLHDFVDKQDPVVRIGAIMGLGLAYAGTQKEEIADLLTQLVTDTDVTMEVSSFAAVALGLTFVGTCHAASVEAMLQGLMLRGETELADPFAKQLVLGLGLLFLGKQGAVEATVEVAKTLPEQISQYAQVVLQTLAYAGTGDVLQIQSLLAMCGEHTEVDENAAWKMAHQGPAALGIAVVAMSEELGTAMAHRALEHLLQYGEPPVRRAIPLALALLNVSSPTLGAMDALSRLSHDTDAEVAQNAVVALGLIGAGTNNARLAGMLRGLSSYYYKEPTLLFLVRVAQGLVHMGKGLLNLAPKHADGNLLSGQQLAGLLALLYSCFDVKGTLGGKHPYVLYYLAAAMRPRMLMTVDVEGKLLPVSVRVGQAIDTVAQAGRPKTITGFQTHTTPVLLSVGDRAELATNKYLPLTSVLEGVVIVKENPDYIETNE